MSFWFDNLEPLFRKDVTVDFKLERVFAIVWKPYSLKAKRSINGSMRAFCFGLILECLENRIPVPIGKCHLDLCLPVASGKRDL